MNDSSQVVTLGADGSPAWPTYSGSGHLDLAGRPATLLSLIHTDYRIHKDMLSNSSLGSVGARPLLYVRTRPTGKRPSTNSSESNRSFLSEQHYDEAARQLQSLQDENDEDGLPVLEEGAVKTALSLLGQFQNADYAPPLLTWHGGDAVVMLWTVGTDTLALTVTDGEFGYIMRRGSTQVARKDALKPEIFQIGALK